jgi:hypothetical protein
MGILGVGTKQAPAKIDRLMVDQHPLPQVGPLDSKYQDPACQRPPKKSASHALI